jgi:hypothetical protein
MLDPLISLLIKSVSRLSIQERNKEAILFLFVLDFLIDSVSLMINFFFEFVSILYKTQEIIN